MDRSSFGSYYSTLASIIITIFSVSSVALLYFGNLHERTGRAAMINANTAFEMDALRGKIDVKVIDDAARTKLKEKTCRS